MLGILRFILAALVVIAHLSEGTFVSHWGVFAVFGFYVISGYLMTAILNETYRFRFFSFWLNRFLRLYPTYFLVLLFSVFAFLVFPGESSFHQAWEAKYRFSDALGNALIFPFEFYDASFRIVPPAWSVAVELVNYFLLWAIIARNKQMPSVTLLLSLSYHVAMLAMGKPWQALYFPFYAALLPFSLGASIYFYRSWLAILTDKQLQHLAAGSAIAFGLCLLGSGVAELNAIPAFQVLFYLNMVSSAALTACITCKRLSVRYDHFGKQLGDLAYPIFLTHWIVGFIVSKLFSAELNRGYILLAASTLPIVLFSVILSRIANNWFEPLRDIIRGSPSGSTPSASLGTEKPISASDMGPKSTIV